MFATMAHGNQRRKYTDEPYIFHPLSVALIVKHYTNCDENAICATVLHDVVEDTDCTQSEIDELFGDTIGRLVFDVTDDPPAAGGSRSERKEKTH
jgi:(p)ppGpp synthase/HD superfamily hydrolase